MFKNRILPITTQAKLLSLNRTGLYYLSAPPSPQEIATKHEIDRIYTDDPYMGSRPITAILNRTGFPISRPTVQKYMREMGIAAIYPKLNLNMYVAITGSGKAKVIQFREDKCHPGTNKKSTKVIKTLGNCERMGAEDPAIIAKLKEQARILTREKKESSKPLTLQVSSIAITRPDDVTPSYYFGHSLIKQFWKRLKLDIFFKNQCGRKDAETVAQSLFYLVANCCAAPDSIRAGALEQPPFAGLAPLGLDVFYSVLDVLIEQKEAVIVIHQNDLPHKSQFNIPLKCAK